MIYKMVVINMQNPNALIAMAHVSLNANDPYAVFTEFFKYCIFVDPSDQMKLSEVIAAVGEEFGLFMPHHIALKCLSQLERDGIISFCDHVIRRIGTFDTDGFDERRLKYRETETALINELIKYVAPYGRDWTAEYAREQLIKVLDKNRLAYDIFLHKSEAAVVDDLPVDETIEDEITDNEAGESNDEDQPLFRDDFLVGKFVQNLLGSNTPGEDYLKQICEGLMVCVGTYQLPSASGENVHPSIEGTAFFFDTRLLLRLLGCAGDAAVTATKELVKLIQDSGGLVYYYPHTREEIVRAFSDAISCLDSGCPPRDNEMRIYAAKIKNSVTVMRAKQASFVAELAKQNIYPKPLNDYNDSDRIRFGFDYDDLFKYMSKYLRWDIHTVENDARSIWETHMRRQGDYSEYCGTSKKLCVFVTSNPRLVEVALSFRTNRQEIHTIQTWRNSCLPVITDMRLTCRLWEPAAQGERLSLLYLTANAVAAQRPTQKYYNRIRALVEDLEAQTPEYAGIYLPAYFDDTVTDAVFQNTKGQEENLNIATFASTLEELTEWKAKKQEDITQKAEKEREEITNALTVQTQSIIDGAVERVKGKLGLSGVLLRASLWLPMILGIVIAVAIAIVSLLVDIWGLRIVAVCIVLLSIVGQVTSSSMLTKMVLKHTLAWSKNHLSTYIKKSLQKAEKPYETEITRRAIEETALIAKCEGMLSDTE